MPDPINSFTEHMRQQIAAAGLDLAEVRSFCRHLEAVDNLAAAMHMLDHTELDPQPASEWIAQQAADDEQDE